MLLSLQGLLLPQEEHKLGKQQEENPNLVKEIKLIDNWVQVPRPILLQQVFTHHSYEEGCSSFERLTHVGDATLDFFITKEHYFLCPDLDPGKLTQFRAANVDTEKVARAALKHQLHEYL
ncbi:Endoribonuclease Dicer [Sesamum angolense]|uniref:Endoribonuclease Dicer n=1 Tax=Sesamum angolense TaxID=2727404 RepID=A0AAE1W3T6_9LAMI|nr:Endoribonuclease Dicer [Sesamum angolense]